jgi:hypothetical protein
MEEPSKTHNTEGKTNQLIAMTDAVKAAEHPRRVPVGFGETQLIVICSLKIS